MTIRWIRTVILGPASGQLDETRSGTQARVGQDGDDCARRLMSSTRAISDQKAGGVQIEGKCLRRAAGQRYRADQCPTCSSPA